MGRLLLATAALVVAVASPAVAQQGNYAPYFQKDGGAQVPAYLMMCAESPDSRKAIPCGTMAGPFVVTSLPFRRVHRDPIRLKSLTQTPQVFDVRALRPSSATTYRVVIPCAENVRLLGTMDANEALTDDKGVLYLAGTDVVMGTSRPDYIIAKTMAPPSSDCTPEMHYGMWGG